MQLSVDSLPAVARLQTLKQRLREDVGGAIENGAAQLLALVRAKLSGEVLNARSGALCDSIRAETDGLSARLYSAAVPYARIQEYGGRIDMPETAPARANVLAFACGGRIVFAKRAAAHVVAIPERSYMRSSLAEFAPAFVENIRRVAAGSVA